MDIKSLKDIATGAMDKERDTFTALSDKIWEYSELSLKEYKSAAEYLRVLAELGFEAEGGICGLETAFVGKAGSGRPYIAILGEYDALTGLSQVGGIAEKCEAEKGGAGHGCGHNLLGAGALAAAYGVKEYLKKSGKSGTVFFFGTPGEEGGAGKAYMAKQGVFSDMDAALTWHPFDVNEITTGTCNSCIQVLYKFRGVASHAAGDPEHGRSALDAVELMNTGVQYLREHTKDDARIHYAIIDGGGISPNVVQPRASVLYMVRSKLVGDALDLCRRVDKIADGAALMTETEYERVFIDGCSGTVPNHTLEEVLYSNLIDTPLPVYTKEELEYAEAIKATYNTYGKIPGLAAEYDKAAREELAALSEGGTLVINNFYAPLYTGDAFSPGSTDVGDVSWQTPTAQVYTASFTSGAPGHSWQNVSLAKSSVGHKGMLLAAHAIAKTAVELFECPELLKKAKSEHASMTSGGYVSPIPDGETIKKIEN